jgi:sugar-specific transcriptional regulator TrmB
MSDIVSALEALGFSLNESRAYAALLAESPATGYEVGVRAQIPRSAVYGVLRRLVKAGAARSIAGTPERFVAAPASDLVAMLERRFASSAERFQAQARELQEPKAVADAFTVRGYDRILEEALRLVHGAKERLAVSGWAREISLLEAELRRAAHRLPTVVIFSHCVLPKIPEAEIFSYELPENELEAFWKHRLTIVADDRTTLIGATEQRESDDAVLSGSAAIAEIATSQIALDVTLLAQRSPRRDVEGVMARLLGDRVGRLDTLLSDAPVRPAPASAGASGKAARAKRR